MIETKISEFVTKLSRGVFRLSLADAKKIVEMVANRGQSGSYARLYKWNPAGKGSWTHYRDIKTTDEMIDIRIREALEKGPCKDFYRYELYKADGLFQGELLDLSPHLFD